MASADISASATRAGGASRVTPFERRNGALYPPKVVPRQTAAGALRYLYELTRDPLLSLTAAAYEEPMIVRESPVSIVVACSPEVARTVLVDRRADFDEKPSLQRYILGRLLGNGILLAEGADWRWQRHTASPLFRRSEILGYVPVMSEAATATVRRWRATSGGIQDIAGDMSHATYDVIGRTILIGGSTEVRAEIDREGRYARGLRWATTYGLLRMPDWVPRPGRSPMDRRDANLRNIVDRMIAAHQAGGGGGDDLLSRLLAAVREDTGECMTRGALVDNVLTFLLAGHHTTATALTWTLYLLACAPEWQQRLVDEIEAVAPEGPIVGAHVDRLPLVQQVLKESMRLFPPVPFLARVATCDTELAGRKIAKGSLVSIPIYALHRHKTAWKDPDRFDPDRFAEGKEPRANSCCFLPFGAGPRVCIGSAFALIEGTVFLATLLRAARFDLPRPDFEPVPMSSVLLVPKQGMPLAVTLRR